MSVVFALSPSLIFYQCEFLVAMTTSVIELSMLCLASIAGVPIARVISREHKKQADVMSGIFDQAQHMTNENIALVMCERRLTKMDYETYELTRIIGNLAVEFDARGGQTRLGRQIGTEIRISHQAKVTLYQRCIMQFDDVSALTQYCAKQGFGSL